jgi:outer membrane protein TolC
MEDHARDRCGQKRGRSGLSVPRKRVASPFLPLAMALAIATTSGCGPEYGPACRKFILPEARTFDYHDPARFPPARIPDIVPPRTVTNPRPETPDWNLSLDEAIRISLENARVIRVLAGTSAVSSGQTIYDTAITQTQIDQAQGVFDPTFSQKNLWSRSNPPSATLDPLNPFQSIIFGSPTDSYQSTVGLTKTNVLGGQFALNYVENPVLFTHPPSFGSGAFATGFSSFALNPQQTHTLQFSYTQPLLQGAGFAVNTAPIVIARLNTEQSYFQYKDSVQEMVRGVIQAYWDLVLARTDVWARRIQVEQSEFAFNLAKAKLETGLGSRSDEAQARVTLNQFKASLIAAEAAVLAQEGALRNILGLLPSDDRRIVPDSVPAERRLAPEWDALVKLAEQRRPDIVELKIIVEADRQRLLQAENQALPQLNAVASYQFNGLSGTMPNGDKLSTAPGQFDNWSVGINFSVPLGLRAERARVRQQSLLVLRDRSNVEQSIHAAVHQLAATVRDLDSSFEQYQAFKLTRAAASTNLTVQIAAFRAGGVGGGGRPVNYLNVLQALNDWGSAVSSEAQQLLAYNVALATLERQTGTILETHGLVFNEERFRAAGPIPCHDRLYPEALPPSGSPNLYPATDEPSENAFDLRKPDTRGLRLPDKDGPPPGPRPELLPPPTEQPPIKQVSWPAAPQQRRERFPDLLEWPAKPK